MTGPVSFNSGFEALEKIRIVLITVEVDNTKQLFLQCYVWAIFFKNRIEVFLIPQRFASWYINKVFVKNLDVLICKVIVVRHIQWVFTYCCLWDHSWKWATTSVLVTSIFWHDQKYWCESRKYFTLQFILAYQRTFKICSNLPLILTRNLGKKCVVF